MAGKYQFGKQKQLDEITDKLLNRDKFSYDLNGDAFYNQYKDKFTQQGKMAMMDTMGQAAALTGGYGSSYAQQVGQQTYQGYLQNLNDVVPELYQLALDNYDRQGDALAQQYSLLSEQEAQGYSRYRDEVADRQYQQQLAYQKEQDQKQLAYQQEQDAREKELSAAELMAQSGDYSRLAAIYGLSEKEVAALREAQLAAQQEENDGGDNGYQMTFSDANKLYESTGDFSYMKGFVTDEQYYRQMADESEQVKYMTQRVEDLVNGWKGVGLDSATAAQYAVRTIDKILKEESLDLSEGEMLALYHILEKKGYING